MRRNQAAASVIKHHRAESSTTKRNHEQQCPARRLFDGAARLVRGRTLVCALSTRRQSCGVSMTPRSSACRSSPSASLTLPVASKATMPSVYGAVPVAGNMPSARGGLGFIGLLHLARVCVCARGGACQYPWLSKKFFSQVRTYMQGLRARTVDTRVRNGPRSLGCKRGLQPRPQLCLAAFGVQTEARKFLLHGTVTAGVYGGRSGVCVCVCGDGGRMCVCGWWVEGGAGQR